MTIVATVAAGRRGAGGGRAARRRGHRGGGDRPAHAACRSTSTRSSPRSGAPGARWSRTRRCRVGGFGAEIAARLQAAAFDYLEAPIQRVGAPFTPVPLSPPLEDAYRPGAEQIYAAARAALRVGRATTTEPCASGARSTRREAARSGRLAGAVEREQRRARHAARARSRWRSDDLEVGDREPGVLAGDRSRRERPARLLDRLDQPTCWRWAMTRISRDSGSSASASTNALGPRERQRRRSPSSERSSSGLRPSSAGARGSASLSCDVALERLVVGPMHELARSAR